MLRQKARKHLPMSAFKQAPMEGELAARQCGVIYKLLKRVSEHMRADCELCKRALTNVKSFCTSDYNEETSKREMSGFFRNVSSSSESSSTESDDEHEPKRVQAPKKKRLAPAFLPSDSGGEEDVKRVVRSAKEKRCFSFITFSSKRAFFAAPTS